MYPPPRCAFKEETSYMLEDSNTFTFAIVHLHAHPPYRHCPGRFLGIIGQNPSVSKSDRLHVVIFWFLSTNLRYIL
jgi:hypothetical protein